MKSRFLHWRPAPATGPLPIAWLEAESDLYLANRWCLNPFPTIAELTERLQHELRRAGAGTLVWHRAEAVANVLMMCCAIADTVDDHLFGASYDIAKAAQFAPIFMSVARLCEGLLALARRIRAWRRRDLARWRSDWGSAIAEFAEATIVRARPRLDAVERAGDRLELLLRSPLPLAVQMRRPRIPGAFRRHDLTHHDVVALARKFAAARPDRGQPLLVLGLRTAGSYFAPVVAACLKADGYADVEVATVNPKKGAAPLEAAAIARCVRRAGRVLIVDEPPDTGATLAAAIGILHRAGCAIDTIVALLPVHPQRRDWTAQFKRLSIESVPMVRLEPEEWHKFGLLASSCVARQLREYLMPRGYHRVTVVESERAAAFNAGLGRDLEAGFGTRLKRVYEVHLMDGHGRSETRYVLAKSVGWGWLGYHAFIAAEALAPFVAPVLGLRDGILYMEWLPQTGGALDAFEREHLPGALASYVAARARLLKLCSDPCPDLSRRRSHDGIELLGGVLGGAAGSRIAAALHGPRIRQALARHSGAVAALIDGRMRPSEWIVAAGRLLKTDFEHHGLGKSELNVTDPAYDLADAILGFGLRRSEERALVARYVEESGDKGVEERLLLNKVLAGSVAMSAARARLDDPRRAASHAAANRRYLDAWHFLAVQTARYCGSVVARRQPVRWRSPLVVLDIDGVVDTRRHGFPCTSAAGIQALCLLHGHDIAIALDTARAVGEVKVYCDAYGCAGAVAEYGSVVWDAVTGCERILASPASLRQLESVRDALRSTQGVYVDEAYRYSVRAYRFIGNAMAALPEAMVETLVAKLGADEVVVRRNTIDTAVHARGVDKGTGLVGLLELAGMRGLDTVAIGDSEVDLPMFRVAGRSFAPASVLCRRAAAQAGCHIVGAAYQRGLLDAVRRVLHPDGTRCERCESATSAWPASRSLFLQLLEYADHRPMGSLARALADPMAIRAFLKTE